MAKKLKIAILVDPMGSMMGSDDDEYAQHVENFTERLGAAHQFYRAHNPGDGIPSGIKEGTDLIIYDYGGMGYGCGDLLASNARSIIRWAQEHPSSLVLVVSMMTWNNQITFELEEMGLTIGDDWTKKSAVPNLMEFHPLMHLPPWFLNVKLPSQVFFEPTNAFVSWFVERFRESLVIDVGAGVGHLAARLREAGVKRCFGIDLFPRDREEAPIYFSDATRYPYPKDCVAVVARPSHGTWVEESIDNMARCLVSNVVYVGLEKNVADDLGKFFSEFRKVGFGAGKDKECVWMKTSACKQPRGARSRR